MGMMIMIPMAHLCMAHLCHSSDDSAECFKELQDASEERCQVNDTKNTKRS